MARTQKAKGRGLVLAGVILGSVVGAALSAVYTPGSGEENRKRIAGWFNSRLSDVSDAAQGRAQAVTSTVQEHLPGASTPT